MMYNKNLFYIKFSKLLYENEILLHLSKSISKDAIDNESLTKNSLLSYVFKKVCNFYKRKMLQFCSHLKKLET